MHTHVGSDAREDIASPHATGSATQIAFALAKDSRLHYRPLFDSLGFPAGGNEWIDISGMDEPEWEKTLYEVNPSVLVTCWGTPAIPENYARDPKTSLRYVCHLAGGLRPIIPRCLIERGVSVSNWGTSISHSVAEHAILLVLALLRNLPAWNSYFDHWPGQITPFTASILNTRSLRGKRVGLHGFGAIACELVAMLKPFQVELASYSKGVPASVFAQHSVRRCDSLEELFSGSDVLIECEALNPYSRGSVSEKILRLLPDGAIFVNVARGQIVDQGALVRLATEKRLSIALDVYEEEPLPLDSPLRRTPHTLLSPHIAGPTMDSFPILAQWAAKNIESYLDGGKIEGLVNLDAYDRIT
jgi:phosphoglycerate dehydrogenase-like enzyme